MKRLRLLSIDCWDTILMDREEWSEAILEIIHLELLKHDSLLQQARVRFAYEAESEQFRDRLLDEYVSTSNVQRVNTIARLLGLQLPDIELHRIASSVDSIIFRPLPDLHPGVVSFLSNVAERGVFICLISNTGWLSGKAIGSALQSQGLTRYFDHMIFSDSAECAKPCRRIFESALSLFACSPADCVHIGDSTFTDIEGALSVGMNAVRLSSTQPAISTAHTSFDDFERIKEYLASTFEWCPRPTGA